jgi:hypothetical protein
MVCRLASDLFRLHGTGDGTTWDFDTVLIEVGVCAEGTVGEIDVEIWIAVFLLRAVS